MKKILALMLATLMILCLAACAKTDEKETGDEDKLNVEQNEISVKSGKFLYDTNDEGDYEIVKYVPSGVSTVDLLELPKTTSDGRDIVGIADEAFKAVLTIKAVSIPDTYTYIGSFAFYDCDGLESITLPGSVSEIGKYCFAECDKLSSVTLSSSLATISEGTFKNCVSLIAISLPESTVEICDSAFFGCKALTDVTIQKTIKSVTKNAFYNCDSLNYTISENAKYLGNENNPYLVLVSALDLNIEECKVNKNTTVIADNAFANCKYLEKLELGAKVSRINNSVIAGCESLEINEYDNARYLGTAENPYAVMISVINLSHESLKLHADTRIITAEAFENCIKLEAISYDNTTAAWKKIIKTEDWNHGINILVVCNGDNKAE